MYHLLILKNNEQVGLLVFGSAFQLGQFVGTVLGISLFYECEFIAINLKEGIIFDV